MTDTLLADLARRFEFHGNHLYHGQSPENSSPLYEHLALGVAADSDVLRLMIKADRATQVSNLLLGAVHFLLLSGTIHPLVDFYPDLTANPRPPQEAYPYFRAFCLEYADEIRRLVNTRRVQTNEVRRCACLLPAFGLISRRAQGRPLALVEIGASAGLNLLWDRYGYDYGHAGRTGDEASPVQLRCEIRSEAHPPIPQPMPKVAYRTGIDLMPIDVRDDNATLWLRALIWPEQMDRARLLDSAIQLTRRDPPTLIAGDMVERLPEVFVNVPPDAVLCVYHSYTLNQCSKEIREAVLELLTAYAAQHDLFRVSLEWYAGQEMPELELIAYWGGSVQRELLARCESHGRWMEWLLPEEWTASSPAKLV